MYEGCPKNKVHTAQNQEGLAENVWKIIFTMLTQSSFFSILLVKIHQFAYAEEVVRKVYRKTRCAHSYVNNQGHLHDDVTRCF